jgi:hypothetical protein
MRPFTAIGSGLNAIVPTAELTSAGGITLNENSRPNQQYAAY